MKKVRFMVTVLCMVSVSLSVAQTETFDNLNANYGVNKSILWYSSNYGNGFGHRIINADPGGKTLLNFQGRNNTATWSTIMTLTSNGNVGVGTTSPEAKLEVVRGGTLGGAWNPSASYFTISDTGSQKIIMDSNEIYGSSTLHFGAQTGDIVRFRTVSPTSDKMVIKSSGNVGIGTTNPEEKLEIKDGSILVNGLSPSITVKNRTAGVGSWVDLAAAPCNGCYSKFAKKGSIVLRGVSYNGDFFITNPGNTGITFATGNWDNATNPQQERMTITNTGNVGIGTSNPDAKLQIFGNNANSTNLILGANYEDRYRWKFKTTDRGYAIDLDFIATNNDDTEEAVLKLTRSSSGRPEFQLYNNAMVANNGKVGVGTANPRTKLEINTGTSGDAVLRIEADTNNSVEGHNSRIEMYQDGALHGALIGFDNTWGGHAAADNIFRIATRSSGINDYNNFTINPMDRTVGIGTADTKGHKLGVAGDIIAEEIKVLLQADWPDYVFNDAYELPTLDEVSEHITQKGHLPNIPSAAEVAENGIYLGEMNAKLLEKIEELTLYTIAQEKRIKELESRDQKLKELENKIEALLTTNK